MRIGLQTWGSEGDIRPFLALGHGLAARGHVVELVYTEIGDRRYEHVAQALGFTARAVGQPMMPRPDDMLRLGQRVVEARDPLTQGRLLNRFFFQPVVDTIYDAAVDLCRRSDLVIGHFFLYPLRAAAEQAGRTAMSITFAHAMLPSRRIHPVGTPNLGRWGNVVEWQIARLALNLTMLPEVNRFRSRLGLPKCRDLLRDVWSSHVLNLVAVSPVICPPPPDWPAWHALCGFLELPPTEHERVPRDVEQFLADGPPPVFMGFGSLMPTDSPQLTDTVKVMAGAARQARCRAIIQANIAPPAGLTDRDILVVKRTPHAAIFSRCAAVVHHAGAGTTHTTLRAGVPSIPVPHVSDQFSWSEDLVRLGVAATPLPRRSFTVARLANRLTAVLGNHAMRRTAEAAGLRMRGEDGVTTAADLIESRVGWNET